MIIPGRIWKNGNEWIAECELASVVTQGESREDAAEMLADAFESLIGRPGLRVSVSELGGDAVSIEASDPLAFSAFVLGRIRQLSGKSLSDVANVLGSSSRNAFARYEHGTSAPTIEKFDELLRAVDPDLTLCIARKGQVVHVKKVDGKFVVLPHKLKPVRVADVAMKKANDRKRRTKTTTR